VNETFDRSEMDKVTYHKTIIEDPEFMERKNEWDDKIEKVGMKEFAKRFVDALREEKHVINPEEFFQWTHPSDDNMEELEREFNERMNKLALEFFAERMELFSPDAIFLTLAQHDGYDIPDSVFQKLRENP
jgi:hypothetical protein